MTPVDKSSLNDMGGRTGTKKKSKIKNSAQKATDWLFAIVI